jgi:axial budding pattern protein 2
MSVGLPVRLSGAGHGAGGPGPLGFGEARRSWRQTVESSGSEEGRMTPVDLDAFPEPPGGQDGNVEEQREQMAKASIRLVPSSSSHSGSLVDQRQKWVRDRAKDRYERGSGFSHAWSSKGHSRARELDSSIRSPSRLKNGSVSSDGPLRRRLTPRSWSQSSSIGAPFRPETLKGMRSPDSHLVRHPSNLRRTLSTVSSGRFDSTESKSNSSWIDDLIEEEDEDGRRRWVAIDKPSQENAEVTSPSLREGGDSEQGSWGKNPGTGGLGALRANIQAAGPAVPSGERRWKLGGHHAKRPISVDEGELQRSQGSQRGNLAFV